MIDLLKLGDRLWRARRQRHAVRVVDLVGNDLHVDRVVVAVPAIVHDVLADRCVGRELKVGDVRSRRVVHANLVAMHADNVRRLGRLVERAAIVLLAVVGILELIDLVARVVAWRARERALERRIALNVQLVGARDHALKVVVGTTVLQRRRLVLAMILFKLGRNGTYAARTFAMNFDDPKKKTGKTQCARVPNTENSILHYLCWHRPHSNRHPCICLCAKTFSCGPLP
jgi:hypothetical protein